MEFLWTDNTKTQIYQDGLIIRHTVFVMEQAVDMALEVDELEELCHYVVLYNDNKAIATARIYPKSKETGKVQRVAVLKEARGKHFGESLMKEVEKKAKELGFSTLILGAQNQAIPFYEKLGFSVFGEEYEDAGIMHHDMSKVIA